MAPATYDESARGRLEGERLARRYAERRKARDLELLVEFHRPLALALARRYTRTDRREDLEQVACVGLVKAAKRFDPDYGTCFRNYAIPMIVGEMKRFWRDNGWSLHVPRPVQERMAQLRVVAQSFMQESGRAPTARELARILDWSEEDVVDALSAEISAGTVSLEGAPSGADDLALSERVGGEDPAYDLVENIASVRTALPNLTAIERRVLRMRFGHDLSQREIADRLGIPARRVGALLTGALEQLSAMLCGESPGRAGTAARV